MPWAVRSFSRKNASSINFSARILAAAGGIGVLGICYAQSMSSDRPRTALVQPSERSAPVIIGITGRSVPDDEIVDESALRYFAASHQTKRVQAEIRRLRSLHPNWVVPTDLDTLKPSPPEEAPLWDLFTAGRFDDLNAAIAARRAVDPDWQPSEDLARKLSRSTLRSAVKASAETGAWNEIITRAKADPDGVSEADIDIAWLVAEAYARTGQTGAAISVYRSILTKHTEAQLRIATIQKAMSALAMEHVENLISLARSTPDGANELQPIQLDITRARIVAALHDEPAAPVEPADLAAFTENVRKHSDPNQMGLLGWYSYHRRQYREALDWFKAALARGGDAAIAHGLALSLNQIGQEREAEEVAYSWSDASVTNTLLYTDIVAHRLMTRSANVQVEPSRLDRFAKMVLATSSGEGAEALGWYAYNSCQFDTALAWFQRAIGWMPRESVVLGYSITLQRLNRARDFFEVINRYDGVFPKVVDLAFKVEPRTASEPNPCGAGSIPMDMASTAPLAPVFRIPKPVAKVAIQQGQTIPLKKTEFPIAVNAENPFRFSPRQDIPDHARDSEYLHEAAESPQLIARRVIGVGAMPYEQLGYTLLPAWNGSERPGFDVNVSAAPAGTLAHDEQTRSGLGEPLVKNTLHSEADRFGGFDMNSGDVIAGRAVVQQR